MSVLCFRNQRATAVIAHACGIVGAEYRRVVFGYRHPDYVRARWMACLALRRGLGMSFPEIAEAVFAVKSHTSALTACRSAARLCDPASDDFDELFALQVESLILADRIACRDRYRSATV